MSMDQTDNEQVGDVILGAPFVECYCQTVVKDDILVRSRAPLRVGSGGVVTWTETETQDGGWTRKLTREFCTYRPDPSRANAEYVVISRDAGFDGVLKVVIKRLASDGSFDPNGEEIEFTRRCCDNTDITSPTTVLRRMTPVYPTNPAPINFI